MIRKELVEPGPEHDTYILEGHMIFDRVHVWRMVQLLWRCNSYADARTRALSVLDKLSQDTFELYDSYRVVQVLGYTPEVDA